MNNYIIDIDDLSNDEYEYFYSLMSASRRKAVDLKKKNVDKKRTVAGEMLVKKHFGIDSLIEAGENKKPFLVNKDGCFSISHSGEYVIVSTSKNPVGVDIEKIRAVNLKVAKRICSEKELLYIFGKNPDENDFLSINRETLLRFFEVWTFKEAYYKCYGATNLYSIDYFDKRVERIKKIMDDYIIHIVKGGAK